MPKVRMALFLRSSCEFLESSASVQHTSGETDEQEARIWGQLHRSTPLPLPYPCSWPVLGCSGPDAARRARVNKHGN